MIFSSLKKKYIYVADPPSLGRADRQILAQHDIDEGEEKDFKYFYLHDRLGSVRQIINTSGLVQKYYTYEPFGQTIESGGTLDNAFMFTGQYFDSEIEEYYLRARQYNPHIARFTSHDPIAFLTCEKRKESVLSLMGRSSIFAAIVDLSSTVKHRLAGAYQTLRDMPIPNSVLTHRQISYLGHLTK